MKKVKIKGEEIEISDDYYALYNILDRIFEEMVRNR